MKVKEIKETRKSTEAKSEVLDNPKPSFSPLVKQDLKGLPSKGVPYPPGTEIYFRAYTFGEVKQLNQSLNSGYKDNLRLVLSGIDVRGDMNVEDLTMHDALFLGFLRKRFTLPSGTEKIIIPFKCPACSEEDQHIIKDTDPIKTNDLDIDKLPCVVNINGEDHSFTPTTVKQSFSLIDVVDVLSADEEALKAKDLELLNIASWCTTHDLDTAYENIFNANPDAAHDLNEMVEIFDHGLEALKVKCKHCEHEFEDYLEGLDRLVLPFRDESKPRTSSSLRFGK